MTTAGIMIDNLLDKIDILGYEISCMEGLISKRKFKQLLKRFQSKREIFSDNTLVHIMRALIESVPNPKRFDTLTVMNVLRVDKETAERALFLMAEKMKEDK